MKRYFSLVVLTICIHAATAQPPKIDSSRYHRLMNFNSEQDHDNMMQQLGIKKLRPGRSVNESAPNHANYDESLANPCPQLPDLLTAKDGKKITTPSAWWNVRRPEIVEDMEREVYGRLAKKIPAVKWTIKIVDREFVGRTPVIAKQLI